MKCTLEKGNSSQDEGEERTAAAGYELHQNELEIILMSVHNPSECPEVSLLTRNILGQRDNKLGGAT